MGVDQQKSLPRYQMDRYVDRRLYWFRSVILDVWASPDDDFLQNVPANYLHINVLIMFNLFLLYASIFCIYLNMHIAKPAILVFNVFSWG